MDATSRNFSFYLKRITGSILLLALSAVFLFSAGSKLWVIQPFEWSFIDILPIGITTASIVARLFIGLEILIAFFLLAHIFLKRFTYKAAITLLVLLTFYLILLLIKQGNNGNCGCFGEIAPMKPLTSIWKNLLMIAATASLFFLYPVKPYKHQGWLGLGLAAVAFALPFILNPVYLSSEGRKLHEAINLDLIYQQGQPAPPVELRKGKHIIAFFSLTCPHCRKAAYLMQILHRQYPEIPFYVVLGGRQKDIASFFEETKSETLPHSLLENERAFIGMAGSAVPAIYWVNNSVIERETNYIQMKPASIRTWLKN